MRARWLPALVFAAFLQPPAQASAQSAKAYVSSQGSDFISCGSLESPCLTIRYALSVLLADGEIDILGDLAFANFDFTKPGITINKAVTIRASDDHPARIDSFAEAIAINAPATATIVLRNLDISGVKPAVGQGRKGILFNSGAKLHLDRVRIHGFRNAGLDFAPSNDSTLLVENSSFTDNGGPGVWVRSPANQTVHATLSDIVSTRNAYGVLVQNAASAVVTNSRITDNATVGVYSNSHAGQINIDTCLLEGNPNGALAASATGAISLSHTSVYRNVRGIRSLNSGRLISFGNNSFLGNGADGAFTSSVTMK